MPEFALLEWRRPGSSSCFLHVSARSFPEENLCRAVLVLLRLFAFPFKPEAKPAWLGDVHLCCLLFQHVKYKFLLNVSGVLEGPQSDIQAALPAASLEAGELCLGVHMEEFGICMCKCICICTYIHVLAAA